MKKIKAHNGLKASLIGGIATLMAVPLILSASAGVNDSGLIVKAEDSKDSSIVAYAGVTKSPDSEPGNGGENPGDPGSPEDAEGIFKFTIDTSLCEDPTIMFYEISPNAKLVSETGKEADLIDSSGNDKQTKLEESGTWTFTGEFNMVTNYQPPSVDASCLISVDEWKGTGAVSGQFPSRNLISVVEPPKSVTDRSSMFAMASKFNQDISGWDMSEVTAITGMFEDATSFDQPIGNWDTSNVEDMWGTFRGAYTFDQDLSQWNTSKVRNMDYMFERATSFKGKGIEGWNVCNIKTEPRSFLPSSDSSLTSPHWGDCS